MKYCRECGEKNTVDSSFCTKCGTQFMQLDETGKSVQKIRTDLAPVKPVLYTRNFLLWWLLSYIATPVYLIYIYLNFEDMNKLEEIDDANEGPSMSMEKDSIIVYLILSLFIPFVGLVVRYWKFDKFHKYLTFNSEKNQTMPISGKKRLWLNIITVFFTYAGITLLYMLYWPVATSTALYLGLFIGLGLLCMLIGTSIGIYLIYTEYIWQKAMNERILMIDPNAEEKQLF